MEDLEAIARSKGYGSYVRHIFLCTGQGPCTDGRSVEDLWQYLKQHVPSTVGRSKTECLRICKNGPTALVYPEGTLYHSLDQMKLQRIIDEHLIGGKPVLEYAIMQAPLQAK